MRGYNHRFTSPPNGAVQIAAESRMYSNPNGDVRSATRGTATS
jgi:hypothetical protein